MLSLDPGDETSCEGLKALGRGDVQDGGFAEERPKQRDHGPDSLRPQIPRWNEGDSLVIWHELVPFEDPDCV